MKNSLLTIIFIASTISLFAQQKGLTPLAATNSAQTGSTYAVVVGISDYQDPGIPDLRFADKDAEAFVTYLQSPSGGELDDDHLRLLLNEQASMAQFAIALDWLMEVAQQGDEAIIYFSGHGDVEKKTLTQPGFLLCWDAPARVYMAGGTFALPMLQEVIATLSVQNGVKVVVITDACRSGNLSGSSIGGAQATAANLSRQYSNEIKILSCQPDEYSIEGEQWGGGRGVFSYHLVDALYGMADANNDLSVTLQEVSRYLEDHVTSEVAPVNQVPLVIGNRNEKLADVNVPLLAAIQSGKSSQMGMLSPIDSRGIEADVLAAVDSSVRQLYERFYQTLRDKIFLSPEGNLASVDHSADAYYMRLIDIPELKRLHSTMRRNFAAALQDDAQMAVNAYLHSSQQELKRRRNFDPHYQLYPRTLARAAELLGEQHYMYNSLKAKEYYFEGLLHRLSGEQNSDVNEFLIAESFQLQALEVDSNAAFSWNELGLLARRLENFEQAIPLFEKALSICPRWTLAYTNLGSTFIDLKRYSEAEKICLMAISIDSSFGLARYTLGLIYHHSQSDYDKAEEEYLKALQFDPDYTDAIFNLGLVRYHKMDFKGAGQLWGDYIKHKPKDISAWNNLGYALLFQGKFEESVRVFQQILKMDPDYMSAIAGLASACYGLHQVDEALQWVELIIQKGGTFEELLSDEGLSNLREGEEGWSELIRKYFPEKSKDSISGEKN